jgi:hypothetical protein
LAVDAQAIHELTRGLKTVNRFGEKGRCECLPGFRRTATPAAPARHMGLRRHQRKHRYQQLALLGQCSYHRFQSTEQRSLQQAGKLHQRLAWVNLHEGLAPCSSACFATTEYKEMSPYSNIYCTKCFNSSQQVFHSLP